MNNKDRKVGINIGISRKLLKKIEENIEGKNRSRKITKCVDVGFKLLSQKPLPDA